MDKLTYELTHLCKRCREGSYSTQTARHRILTQVANDLSQLGFKQLQLNSLKAKHVYALRDHWKSQELSDKTQANRMTAIRWWAEKANLSQVVKPNNSDYGIGARSEITKISKAEELKPIMLDKITDPYVKLSVQLQKHFGLRREEAIKFRPEYADLGDKIRLKGSWTKGGRPRIIPITTEEQRKLLDEVKQFVGNGSLIPPTHQYKQQLNVFEYQTREAGIGHTHGLRHSYAQRLYHELTGWQAPCAGGLSYKQLTPEQRKIDLAARLKISAVLGHNRVRITYKYCGK